MDDEAIFNLQSIPDFLKKINRAGPVISRESLYRKINDGSLPSYRFGVKILLNPAEILESMKKAAAVR